MSVNRRRADRGAKPLLHVGVRQDPLSWKERLFDFSIWNQFLELSRLWDRFDSMPLDLVSFTEQTWSHRFK